MSKSAGGVASNLTEGSHKRTKEKKRKEIKREGEKGAGQKNHLKRKIKEGNTQGYPQHPRDIAQHRGPCRCFCLRARHGAPPALSPPSPRRAHFIKVIISLDFLGFLITLLVCSP